MMRMMGCPSTRRRAGMGLLLQLLLLGVLPVAEALHEHGQDARVELHAHEACAHDGARVECLLLLRTAPALPTAGTVAELTTYVAIARAFPGPDADLPVHSGSPALPRAPPLA